MSDDSSNVHFSGVKFICSPYLAIKSALACFARADNGKMRAANESYALKMNTIVIMAGIHPLHSLEFNFDEGTMKLAFPEIFTCCAYE